MPLMTWNDKMSVGVALLDNDHKKLVGMLNQLFDAINSGQGKESLGNILDGLVDYTKIHFANEEKLFAQTGYPDSVAHKKEHDDLTLQVVDLQARCKAGATGALSLEVMTFLKTWLVNHIQGNDKKYTPHLNGNGIH
jgi:hemerythrin